MRLASCWVSKQRRRSAPSATLSFLPVTGRRDVYKRQLLEDDSGLAGVVIRGTLAEYEDTGLEPEEIMEMKARMEAQDG